VHDTRDITLPAETSVSLFVSITHDDSSLVSTAIAVFSHASELEPFELAYWNSRLLSVVACFFTVRTFYWNIVFQPDKHLRTIEILRKVVKYLSSVWNSKAVGVWNAKYYAIALYRFRDTTPETSPTPSGNERRREELDHKNCSNIVHNTTIVKNMMEQLNIKCISSFWVHKLNCNRIYWDEA
jgi:hypothetical protein